MLSKENIDSLVFGGIYTVDNPLDLARFGGRTNTDHPWDQRYLHWVPVRIEKDGKTEFYMVNTYQLSSFGPRRGGNLEAIREKLMSFEQDGSGALYGTSNYYYVGRTLLTDESIKLFHLVADLKDYRIVGEREASEYDEGDVIENVKLFFEHAWPYGLTIVRKDASPSAEKQIRALIHDVTSKSSAPHLAYNADECLAKIRAIKKESPDAVNEKTIAALDSYINVLRKFEVEFAVVNKDLQKNLWEE